jgi:hypothetical protein
MTVTLKFPALFPVLLLSLGDTVMMLIRGVSKKFGECYQKKKTEDTKKLTLFAF